MMVKLGLLDSTFLSCSEGVLDRFLHLPLVVCCANVFVNVVAGGGAEVGAKVVVLIVVVFSLFSVTGTVGIDVV